MMTCSDTEDVFNEVFSVLDEDNESYLEEIPVSRLSVIGYNRSEVISLGEKDVQGVSQRSYDLNERNPPKIIKNQLSDSRTNFYNLYADVESRYFAYKAEAKNAEDFALKHRAAIVIQAIWRRYAFRKIYKRIRDLLITYNGHNSSAILRPVNPREADLMDRASGTFIRFRLSGEIFPPAIVYKIFTNRPIVDLCKNSYPLVIPDDNTKNCSTINVKRYFKTKIIPCRENFLSQKEIPRNINGQGYKRVDKNDWRPFLGSLVEKPRILNLAIMDKDLIGTKTMRKRRIKLELIKRLYENGRQNEEMGRRDVNSA